MHPSGQWVTAIELPETFGKDGFLFVGTETAGVSRIGHDGETATGQGDGIERQAVTGIVSTDEDGQLIVLASTWSQGVYRSSDNGLSWVRHDTGLKKNRQADLYGVPHFSHLLVDGGR